ncbi:MAG: glycyl-radical enzyme activating protein [Erysipelotrichaceae bacterium]|nr:glycyl-radical enzyme activating protein [Erysipelotrichaceae bacterium]
MISVFNIERFATHDGDGIRTVVFLKGCPLHCPWCSNPESWGTEPVLSYNKKKCIGCRRCEKYCKSGAITFENNQFVYNKQFNDLCEESVEQCPKGALEILGKKMNNQEIIEIIMQDIDYYKNSQGGVTISGGEPMYQFKETLSLVKDLKEKDLNIAIETTGQYDLQQLIQIEPYIDTFLFDIKQLDQSKLKMIGGDLKIIMNNFYYLTEKCPHKVVMRIPVIPEFNYTDQYLKEVLSLAKETHVREIDLLPYHTLGKNKWDRIMKPYYSDMKMLDKSELVPYKKIGQEMGLKIKIGG